MPVKSTPHYFAGRGAGAEEQAHEPEAEVLSSVSLTCFVLACQLCGKYVEADPGPKARGIGAYIRSCDGEHIVLALHASQKSCHDVVRSLARSCGVRLLVTQGKRGG
eukprot:4760018-Amphidinium_carterae.1